MFSGCPIGSKDSVWVKCYSTSANPTRKLFKIILSGLFFTKTSIKSTPLD